MTYYERCRDAEMLGMEFVQSLSSFSGVTISVDFTGFERMNKRLLILDIPAILDAPIDMDLSYLSKEEVPVTTMAAFWII